MLVKFAIYAMCIFLFQKSNRGQTVHALHAYVLC